MRIRFKKADLLPAVTAAQNVANASSTIAILSNVLITAEFENQVTLLATDYESRVRIDVPAVVEKKGAATVPAKMFHDLVAELPDTSDIIFETDRGATIECGDIRAELATMPAKDFPKFADPAPDVEQKIGQGALKSLLDRVVFAIPTRDPRRILLGALFEFEADGLRAVATDGKLMAHHRIPLAADFVGEQPFSVVLPHKVLNELDRSLGDEGIVSIGLEDKQVHFQFRNVRLTTNQIEGKYPTWQAVVPKEFTRVLRVPRLAILSALRRASLLSDAQNSAVTLHFNGTSLTIEAESFDKGRIKEVLTLAEPQESFKIVFNYKFLQDVFRSLDKDTISLHVNQPATPAVFRTDGNEDTFYLVMPIKVTEASKPPETTPSTAEDDYDDEPEDLEDEG